MELCSYFIKLALPRALIKSTI